MRAGRTHSPHRYPPAAGPSPKALGMLRQDQHKRTLRAQPHQIAGNHEALAWQSVGPGAAEQHSPAGEHQPKCGSGMCGRQHSESDGDRRDLIAKGAHRQREKDPPKLWLTQKSKSRYCLDSEGSESTRRRNTPPGPSQATAIAYRSELKSQVLSPWISAQPQSTAPHGSRLAELSMQPGSRTATGRYLAVRRGSGFGGIHGVERCL
jgi:hypothetical protein